MSINNLTVSQKKELIKAARNAIEEKLFKEIKTEKADLSDSIFSERFGIFVTLKINHHLRGCIGYVEGIKPLREAVKEMALEAAFGDPRFRPLSREEYPHINVEISILFPKTKVSDFNEIIIGKHGLIAEKGYRRGLLLPQVATEWNWDREEFLRQTCIKAGIEPDYRNPDIQFYKFEAIVFNEDELK